MWSDSWYRVMICSLAGLRSSAVAKRPRAMLCIVENYAVTQSHSIKVIRFWVGCVCVCKFLSISLSYGFWKIQRRIMACLCNKILVWGHSKACFGGAVGSVTVRATWLRWSASPGSRPGLARSLCQVIAVYALRLNSRAGTEGSTVSCLICDRWLILGSETLSISRCLNHW